MTRRATAAWVLAAITATACNVGGDDRAGDAGGPSPDGGASNDADAGGYAGRIARDGRGFVAAGNGDPFLWRGASEFLLLWYLFDPGLPAADGEALVTERIAMRKAQGYTVLRVFGTLDWTPIGGTVELRPYDDLDRYRAAARRLLEIARAQEVYIEWVVFTGVGESIPRDRVDEHIDWAAGLAAELDNTFVEICNESFKNGLSVPEVYAAAQRFRALAPDVMLAGSSPTDDSFDPGAPIEDGHPTDGRRFADPPFDYVTLHSDRSDGDDGWRWVRHLTAGEALGRAIDRPVVQDEPIGSAGAFEPGRRDNDPRRFRAAALVSHASRQYFTFHHQCAVTDTRAADCAGIPTPGADQVRQSDLIPFDARAGQFVPAGATDAPVDASGAIGAGALLDLVSRRADDGRYWSYPLRVTGDIEIAVRAAGDIAIVSTEDGRVIESGPRASGDVIHLAAGSDVVISQTRTSTSSR